MVYKSINLLKKNKISFEEIENQADRAEETDPDEIWYTVEMIRDTIGELPDGYRTVLSLSLFEGYSHDQIAESLALAPSSVRSQSVILLISTDTPKNSSICLLL